LTLSAPIGLFDSGAGGLSVARQFSKVLPSEDLIYFADTARVPYGDRPLAEVRGFALEICEFLVSQKVKAIVMACNISSAVALQSAQCLFPNIPIIGVIVPGVTAAVAQGAKRLGVLATQGTVASGAYPDSAHHIAPEISVTQSACPQFVPIVEAGEANSQEAQEAARLYLAPLAQAKCDTIVYGCTHYPFLSQTLLRISEELFEKDALPQFVDPAIETALVTKSILAERDLLSGGECPGKSIYYTSGNPAVLARQGEFFLGGVEISPRHFSLQKQSV